MNATFPALSFQLRTFDNEQRFDLEGVTERLLSSSYAPEAGYSNHAAMKVELAAVFEEHQQNSEIVFEYETRVNYGQMGSM